MPRSSLESTYTVPVTSIVEIPQCLVRHSPSSFAVRVAHKRRKREREELWSDRTVETTDLPDGVARRELERVNERRVETTDLPDGVSGG
jgi:hypothetical protein